jgi:glycosyltransferase involved in cell wall biosynthesis
MYSVAIIIPTLNEELYIEACLNSIFNQSYPFEKMDIMVIDGRSSDTTRQIVERISERYRNVRLLDNPDKIQSVAFNIGVKSSTAPYVVRLDAHALYDCKYIELCLKHLSENSQIGDAGGVWNICSRRDALIPNANSILNKSRFGIGGASYRIGAKAGYVDTVPFGAYPRHVIEEIGGMREDLPRGEDNEYVSRIRKAGYKIYLDPAIVCTYFARDTFTGSVKQMYKNGYSIGQLFHIDRSAVGLRHIVPMAFVLGSLFATVLSLIDFKFTILLFLILGCYFLCNVCASVMESIKYGWKYLLPLVILFFSVHVSYGIGSIIGVIMYRGSNKK